MATASVPAAPSFDPGLHVEHLLDAGRPVVDLVWWGEVPAPVGPPRRQPYRRRVAGYGLGPGLLKDDFGCAVVSLLEERDLLRARVAELEAERRGKRFARRDEAPVRGER